MLLEKPLPIPPQSEPTLSLPPPYQPSPAGHSLSPRQHHATTSEFSLPLPGTSNTNNSFALPSSPLVPALSRTLDQRPNEDDLTTPSFSRSPPAQRPPPFTQEMFLIARNELDKGFPVCAPPFIPANEPNVEGGGGDEMRMMAHPFVSRDVREDDWTRFLTDIKTAASLTYTQREQADNIPFISFVPVLGTLASSTAKHVMKHQRKKVAARVVDRWNHHFFRPRGLECVLTQGRLRLSGNKGAPLPESFGPSCGYDHGKEREREKDTVEETRSSGSSTPVPAALAESTNKSGKLEKRKDVEVKRIQKTDKKAERRKRRDEKRALEREWAQRRTGNGWISDDGAYRLFVLCAKS